MAFRRVILVVAAALALVGCGNNDSAPSGSAAAKKGSAASEPATMSRGGDGPRIVSTVPAATLNLVLIGAGDRLVGVSKYDRVFLPESEQRLPVVGDYETMNYERLVTLHPTAVVVQAAESRIPQRLRDLAGEEHFQIVNIHMDTLDDLWGTVETLGEVSGRKEAAEKAVAGAKEKLKLMAEAMKGRRRPRVVYALSRSPMTIVGGDTFLGQMVKLAGGENVGAEVGTMFPTISDETLVKLKPDVILVSAPDEAEQKGGSGGEDDPRVASWMQLPVPAAWNHRVFLVTDGNTVLASVELPKQVQELAGMIHRGEESGSAGEGRP